MSNISQYVYVTSEMLGWVNTQPTNPPGINQGQPGFGLYAPNVVDLNTHLNKATVTYRLGGWQLNNQQMFSNGQWWKLEAYIGTGDPKTDSNPANWQTVYQQMTPKQDLVSGLGRGDNYIVFATNNGQSHLILSLDGRFTSTPKNETMPLPKPGGDGAPTFKEAEDAYKEAIANRSPKFSTTTSLSGEGAGGAVLRDDPKTAGVDSVIKFNHKITYGNDQKPALDRVEVTIRYTDINGNVRTETHKIYADSATRDANGNYTFSNVELNLHYPPKVIPGSTSEIKIISIVNHFTQGHSYTSPGPFGNLDVICFAAETLIKTAKGPVAAGDLKVGDLVLTRDHGWQPLRWIGKQSLSRAEFAVKPKLRPIRLAAGSMGEGLPSRDLLVSAQHRILVNSVIAERMSSPSGILLAAKFLTEAEGIEVADDLSGVTYVHLLFDRHEVIFAEDLASESLLLGKMALSMLTPQMREEVLQLRPEAAEEGFLDHAACEIMTGPKARNLVARHIKNARAFQRAPEPHSLSLAG